MSKPRGTFWPWNQLGIAGGIGKGVYPVRVFGYLLGALALWFYQTKSGGPILLLYPIVGFYFAYPHLCLWLYVKSGYNSHVEQKFLLVDMFLIGVTVSMLDYAPLASVSFFIVNAATNMGIGGIRLTLKGLLAFVFGVSPFLLFSSFGIASDVPLSVNVCALAYLVFGLFGYHYVDYHRSLAFITARQQIKQQKGEIEKSLTEKNLLLKEVHHRVKNNLQVVYSLLNLQAEHISNEGALAAISAAQSRIKSIALVHQVLYQSTEVQWVDTATYIPRLVTHLENLFATEGAPSFIGMNLQAIKISIESAVPLGLIINELVSNAIKHRTEKKNFYVKIETKYRDDKMYLQVEDNGGGILDLGADGRIEGKFGLQLVEDLVAQLEGDLQLTHNPGTCFSIALPMKIYE